MKIDELPVEILMEIFSYLSSYDKVALVNRQFYNVVCKVNVSLSMDQSFFEEDDNLRLLEGIQNSNRNITRVCIDLTNPSDTQLQSTISLIKTFSTTIKCLIFRLRVRPLTMLDFLEILSLVPNAKHLVFGYLRIQIDNQPSSKTSRRLMTSKADLHLHHLKTLEFDCCDKKFIFVFNRLPARVLAELKWTGFSRELNSLYILFKHQTNIKKLSVHSKRGRGSATVFNDIFDNLILESLVWNIEKYSQKSANFATILSKQVSLKSLDLLYENVDETLMNAVTNHLTELESLSIKNPATAFAAFTNFISLEKLNNLTLRGGFGSTVAFESFITLDKSRITTLDLCDIRMGVDFIIRCAKSIPNLKVLRYACSLGCVTMKAIIHSFNFVEVLKIENLYHLLDEDYNLYSFHRNSSNPKLIELKIDCFFVNPRTLLVFVEKFIVDYPNIKKLILQTTLPLTALLFKLIVNGFTKMESLTLIFDKSELTIDDWHYAKDQNKTLKFIYFKGLPIAGDLKNALSTVFHLVAFDQFEFVISIDGNKWKGGKKLIKEFVECSKH